MQKRRKVKSLKHIFLFLRITYHCYLFIELFCYYRKKCSACFMLFSIWVFFQDHSKVAGLQGNDEVIYLALHYLFHLHHRHLGISRAITGKSLPLHVGSSRNRIGNLCFLAQFAKSNFYVQKTCLLISFIPKSLRKNILMQVFQQKSKWL